MLLKKRSVWFGSRAVFALSMCSVDGPDSIVWARFFEPRTWPKAIDTHRYIRTARAECTNPQGHKVSRTKTVQLRLSGCTGEQGSLEVRASSGFPRFY